MIYLNKSTIFNIYEFEKKTKLAPSIISYKLTDEEFLQIVYSVLEESLGNVPSGIKLSSGTDNEVLLLNTGDLIYRLYANPSKTLIMFSSHYILKFVLSSLMDEHLIVECKTSYRSQDKLYVHINVECNMHNAKKRLCNDFNNLNLYNKALEQISVIENKKIHLLNFINSNK